ncbi:cell division protein ZapA [Parasporobacterium paucivorans]|uniref:Cell division protein ZapA n=1 Tax=Parasporobacterium paucivorans DSM 15970 TaxID=1122934 RepID=A0A1M6ACL3_9FIRM|nr:cell division protein ZapA [Parasporobacterium paucivorans]SHI33923.1 cell division protein ZapA [Parasporobacterium paucivorans DSM 15970]
MTAKNNTEVIIDGNKYTLSGYESEEYLQKVSSYINGKIAEYRKDPAYKKMNFDAQKAMLELNIADEYFKTKKRADELEAEVGDKDRQLYDIKHELVTERLNNQENEKEIIRLKNEANEYQKEIIRLETRMTDMDNSY